MLKALLPLSDREPERRALERAELLLTSLDFFWKGANALPLYIVAPDAEMGDLSKTLRRFDKLEKVDMTVLAESDIDLRISKVNPDFGYAKQMLIKVALPSMASSVDFLTLDADVVACKYFDEDTFYVDGRIITAWDFPTLQQWWFESAKLIGVKIEDGFFDSKKFHVTPQILRSSICRSMTTHIENKWGINWVEYLMSQYNGNHPHIWTEYTLYYLFSRLSGDIKKYAVPDQIKPEQALHCAKQNLWGANSYEHWNPMRAIDGSDPGHFIVIQSILAHDISFDDVKERWVGALGSVRSVTGS